MLLKKTCCLITFLLFCFLLLWPEARGAAIGDLRPEGSRRTYYFFLNQKQLGKLESVYKGTARFEGSQGKRFDERLSLDYNPFGNQYQLEIENRHYVADDGRYLGDDMKLKVNGEKQELFLSLKNGALTGYLERAGSKEEVNKTLPSGIFSLDNYMVDQWETFLALKKFKVGDTIVDSSFVPQVMITVPVKYVVESFGAMTYGGLPDSAYVCHFLEPTDQVIYVARDKRLIKVAQPDQNLLVILSENPMDKLRPPSKSMTFADIVRNIPIYLLYLIAGAVLASPFLIRYYKRRETYVAIVLGGLAYILVQITHVPLQEWYNITYVIPGLQAGRSVFYFAIFNSLFTGLVQEAVKVIPIALVFYLWRKKPLSAMTVGILCATGYGIIEADVLAGMANQMGGWTLISWPTFERLFALIFSITTGAILGFGLGRSWKSLATAWVIAAGVHSVSTYLAVFVQKRIIDIAILEIGIAIVDIALLLGVYLVVKSRQSSPHKKSDGR